MVVGLVESQMLQEVRSPGKQSILKPSAGSVDDEHICQHHPTRSISSQQATINTSSSKLSSQSHSDDQLPCQRPTDKTHPSDPSLDTVDNASNNQSSSQENILGQKPPPDTVATQQNLFLPAKFKSHPISSRLSPQESLSEQKSLPSSTPYIRKRDKEKEALKARLESIKKAIGVGLRERMSRLKRRSQINPKDEEDIRLLFNLLETSLTYNEKHIAQQWQHRYQPEWDEAWLPISEQNRQYQNHVNETRIAIGPSAQKDHVDVVMENTYPAWIDYHENDDDDWSSQCKRIRRALAFIKGTGGNDALLPASEILVGERNHVDMGDIWKEWEGKLDTLGEQPTKKAMREAIPYHWAEIEKLMQGKMKEIEKRKGGEPRMLGLEGKRGMKRLADQLSEGGTAAMQDMKESGWKWKDAGKKRKETEKPAPNDNGGSRGNGTALKGKKMAALKGTGGGGGANGKARKGRKKHAAGKSKH
ncbi:uncharacterized protein KY384_003729 [Bacidia gigantensis]|uniref:uncharacterized protein n=1 Tax=Bacidia gigantensis TaxID=2732470 RepID=UPI001D053AB7|nr:uncharacterized protein KY384_003729 [Bacidia gigantensis]KAG8532092.1 hypothetical protein KY384_003729 [Bacidia gigantensis]